MPVTAPFVTQQVFEVDKSVVLRVKRDLLSRRGPNVMLDGNDIGFAEVIDIGADLSVDGWQGKLLDAGFDPKCPSAWLVEGLTMWANERSTHSEYRTLGALICYAAIRPKPAR